MAEAATRPETKLVRLSPEAHRQAKIAAVRAGVRLDEWLSGAVLETIKRQRRDEDRAETRQAS